MLSDLIYASPLKGNVWGACGRGLGMDMDINGIKNAISTS